MNCCSALYAMRHQTLFRRLLLAFITIVVPFSPILVKADSSPKNGYISFGYGSSTFVQSNDPDIKSDLFLMFNVGHSYHLHKKPVGKMMWFDVDATWLNIAYSSFKVEHIDWQSSHKWRYQIPYIGLQVGPAITITPFKKAQIHAYARYSPSLVCLIVNNSSDDLTFAYGSLWNFGIEFNYRAIGIGLDYARGSSQLPELEFMSNSVYGKTKSSILKSTKLILSIKF